MGWRQVLETCPRGASEQLLPFNFIRSYSRSYSRPYVSWLLPLEQRPQAPWYACSHLHGVPHSLLPVFLGFGVIRSKSSELVFGCS
jgi:hypothetical protein